MRDLELMLNSIYNKTTKEYMSEALNCYNAKSYKACCILSVIAGIDDLYLKIDGLYTEFNNSQKKEFDEIIKKKNNHQPYERELINFCTQNDKEEKSKLDIFTRIEEKDLNSCFDIRNSFAHPTDYKCTAEKARFVFTSMIDLITSRTMILGHQQVNNLLVKMEQPLYFSSKMKESRKEKVVNELNKYLPKVHDRIFSSITKKIISDETGYKENYIYFFSFMSNLVDDKLLNDKIEDLLLNESNKHNVFEIVNVNKNVIDNFNQENLERFLTEIYRNNNDINIEEIDISNRKTDISNDFLNSLIETEDEVPYENLLTLTKLLDDDQHKSFILNSINIINRQIFDIKDMEYLVDKNISLDTQNDLVSQLSFHLQNQDFKFSNPAVTILENYFTYTKLVELNDRNIFKLLFSVIKGADGYSRNAQKYIEKIESKNLYSIFVDRIKSTDAASEEIVQEEFSKLHNMTDILETNNLLTIKNLVSSKQID